MDVADAVSKDSTLFGDIRLRHSRQACRADSLLEKVQITWPSAVMIEAVLFGHSLI